MKTIWKNVPYKNWARAREMRYKPSPPELRLWDSLKSHAVGAHFRRQHPIGVYVVDFCAPRYHLVIEVDGSTHGDESAQEYDRVRDEFLAERSFRVLRFSSNDVMNDLDRVLSLIKEALESTV